MLVVDYPGLDYYPLTQEQIVAERGRNASGTWEGAEESRRAEGAAEISQEALEEVDPWKAYWEAYFDKLKNDILEDFFARVIDQPREKRLKEKMEHREDDALFSENSREQLDDFQ